MTADQVNTKRIAKKFENYSSQSFQDIDIKLLAKLLDSRKEGSKPPLIEEFDSVFAEFEKNLTEALRNSSITDRQNLLMEAVNVFRKYSIYTVFPQLIGNTFVGFANLDNSVCKRSLGDLFPQETINMLFVSKNIPCLILKRIGKDNILFTNTAGKNGFIDNNEFQRINCVLAKKKIVIEKILECYSKESDHNFKNINFLYIPAFEQKRRDFDLLLIPKCDAFIVFVGSKELSAVVDKTLFYLDLCSSNNIPCYIVVNDKFQVFLQQYPQIKNATLITAEEVSDFLHNINSYRYNYAIVDELHVIDLKIKFFYHEREKKINKVLLQLQVDLANTVQEKTKQILRELIDYYIGQKNEYAEEKGKLITTVSSTIKRLERMDQAVQDKILADNSPKMLESPSMIRCWEKIVYYSLEIEDFGIAKKYISRMKKLEHSNVFVFEILLKILTNQNITSSMLKKLENAKEDEFIRRVKIQYGDKFGYSEAKLMELSYNLLNPQNPKEFYYRAQYYERVRNDLNTAVKYYKKALYGGYAEAGTKLFIISENYPHRFPTISKKWLAKQIVTEANYVVGMDLLRQRDVLGAHINLKLAAAHHHTASIRCLADDLKGKIFNKNYYKDITEEEKRKKLETCLKLYLYLDDLTPNESILRESLGLIYKELGDFNRALEYWGGCNTKEAQFQCGLLYLNGSSGCNIDLQRAKQCFQKAIELGHPLAEKMLLEVLNRQRAEACNRANEYNSKSSYETTSKVVERKKVKSGGCFITTATCTALDKGDECEELMAFRTFRDIMKKRNKIVNDLIEEYYRIAPLIVEKINSEKDSTAIYTSLWNQFLMKIYKLVDEKKYNEAVSEYILLVQKLSRKYKIPLAGGIQEKIEAYEFEISVDEKL